MRLQSRQQRSLTRYFPEIVEALRTWFAGEVVLDGELVLCGPDGRLDFAALQHRLTGAHRSPVRASYVVFDVLAAGIATCAPIPTGCGGCCSSSCSTVRNRRSRSSP